MSTPKFAPGQAVIWFRTEGGGGGSGYAPNARSPIKATFLRTGSGAKDYIHVHDTWHDRKTWVSRKNLVLDGTTPEHVLS